MSAALKLTADQEKAFNEVIEKLRGQQDKVNEVAETLTGKLANQDKVTTELKNQVDDEFKKLHKLDQEVANLVQKFAELPPAPFAHPEQVLSSGRQFVQSEKYVEEMKALGLNDNFSGSMSVKLSITKAPASAGVIEDPQRLESQSTLMQPLRVRELMSQTPSQTAAFEFVRTTLFTNSAGITAETAQIPESDMTFALVQLTAKKIAHFMHVSDEALKDLDELANQIDEHLIYGLKLREDEQLLLGAGDPDLEGLIPSATAYAAPAGSVVTGETQLDRLRLAMLQAELALLPATGIVLNPVDWANILLKKDADGRYIIGSPTTEAGPTLWGLSVSTSHHMPVGTFLIGAFRSAATIRDVSEASIEASTEDRDNFIKDMVTIKAVERLALINYRPQSFVTGNFTGIGA